MLSRRNFLASVATVAGGLQAASLKAAEAPAQGAAAAGTGRAKVYFTKDLSAAGLLKLYKLVNGDITGRTALKLHTGEPNGPNIIPREWVKAFQAEVPSTIVECNVFYASPRQTTAGHREVLKTNGWTFSPVDIMDEDGDVALPIKGGKWLKEVHVGKHLLNYDSMIVLTHFKGHTMGGFGGCLKNIAIGCASGAQGKRELHREGNNDWAGGPHFMERMVEGGKAVTDHFGKHITYLSVMRRMSVDCDCVGTSGSRHRDSRLDRHSRDRQGGDRHGLRAPRKGTPRPGRAHRIAQRSASALLHARTPHGFGPVRADRSLSVTESAHPSEG